jgi:HSP20 family protein
MNSITRWNPLREMAAMQSAMDRLFDETWRPLLEGREISLNSLALDVHETDAAYTVTTEMPGVQADNIHVRIDGDYLLIEGEIPEEVVQEKGARALIRERRFGRFSRRIRLPLPVENDKIEATYDNGVLKLVLPKAEAVQPKQIPVRVVSNN